MIDVLCVGGPRHMKKFQSKTRRWLMNGRIIKFDNKLTVQSWSGTDFLSFDSPHG